jgi:TonB family protein
MIGSLYKKNEKWGIFMKPLVFSFLAAIIATSANLAEAAEIVPANPISRIAPDYPAKCFPSGPGPYSDQRVTVGYDVSREGVPENVRVSESTDPCFEDVAVAAIRNATYAPQMVDGRTVKQEELETTFTFRFVEAGTIPQATLEDFDGKPLVRMPPQYPRRCMDTARSSEIVIVEFDVNEAGDTENIKVVDSTLRCLESPSVSSVAEWKYAPRMREGKPVRRTGVQTLISFQLSGRGVAPSAQDEIRRAVWFRLSSVRADLLKDRSPAVLLADLEELERKYGPEFTKNEAALFHQVRAGVRIKAQDYAGALDDLRIVKRSRVITDKRTIEAIDKAIAQLEAIVGAPTTQESPPTDEGAASPSASEEPPAEKSPSPQ